MNRSFFSFGSAEEHQVLSDMLSGRSGQELVKDEVVFAPPIDQWKAISKAAEQMHSRRAEGIPPMQKRRAETA